MNNGLDEPCLQDLYDHAPCGYLSTSLDGDVLLVNETFLQWTGYARQQVVGAPFNDLLTVGSQLFYDTRCLPVLRLEGEIREVALVLRRADGRDLSVLVNSTVRPGHDARPSLVRTAVFDSTARQDYERDLLAARRAAERSEARGRVLQQASSSFGAAKSERTVTTALAGIACSAFDARTTTVLLLDDGRGLRAADGTPHPLGDTVARDATRPEAEALRTGDVVTLTNLDEVDRRFPDLAQAMYAARIEAMTVTPLVDEDETLGVAVCLFGRRRDFDSDEVALHRALGQQAGQALQRIRLSEQLRQMALHDRLTGLANREMLQYRLTQVLGAAARSRRPVAVLFLDLDGFKAVNDQLGHAAGDSVLVQVAHRLGQSVRDSDTVARFGGDEFIVVCDDVDARSAERIAERILVAVREPLPGIPPEFPVTVSIGLARHRPDRGRIMEPDALLRQADAAMYRSKEGGKDRCTAVDV